MTKGMVACVWLLAVGCASTPPARSGPALRAVKLSDRAAAAFAEGDNGRALRDYQWALKLSRTADDRDGIASILTNIAIVQRKLGNPVGAHASLAQVLEPTDPAFTPVQRSRAALVEAMVCVDEADLACAESAVTTGLALCHRPRCSLAGKFLNLRARIALTRGDPHRALTMATDGLEANKRQHDALEEANSLRLAAEARALMKDYEAARTLYERAYRLDESGGHDVKAAADLRGIGRTFLGRGEFAEALHYYRRARAISERAGDDEGRAEAVRLIQEAEREGQNE